MQISRHISALLYEHDCVIIPGFGAFVGNHLPAFIDKKRNQFHPPFKKLTFNRSLKNNDGLLANEVSRAEGIPFSAALQLISEFVSALNNELQHSRRAELKNIGRFFQGNENTLHFEQDETINYLPESTGFSIFYSPPIKRKPVERKFEKALKDKVITVSKDKKIQPVRKSNAGKYVAVVASALILCLLVSVSLFTGLLKNVNIAGLNPFAANAEALYKPAPNNMEEASEVKNSVSALFASNIDTTCYLNIVINGTLPIVVRLKEETKEADAPVHKTKNGKRFNIIGGAFAVPENAEKLKRKLKNSGYDAVIIERKLHLVSYGSYATREEALHALEKIRAVQSDAWLMSN